MAIPSRGISRSSSENKMGSEEGNNQHQQHSDRLLSQSSHTPSSNKSLLAAPQQGSRRNLFQRATSLRRIHENDTKTDDQQTATTSRVSPRHYTRCALTLQGSRRNLLLRTVSMKRVHESNLANESEQNQAKQQHLDPRRLMKRGYSDRGLGMAPPSSSSTAAAAASSDIRSIAPSISRASADRRPLLSRNLSDRRLEMVRTSSFSKLFGKSSSKRDLSQHAEEDKTDSLMAEMLTSSGHSPRSRPDSLSQLSGSSHSVMSKTPSRRDMFGSQSSVRNLFSQNSASNTGAEPKVSFFDEDADGGIQVETFVYKGVTEEEKPLVYDGRSEKEIFKSTKWLACCKLVHGSGVYKQSVDAVFGEEKKKSKRRGGAGADDCQRNVELITESDLRGLEEVYSSAVQIRRTRIVRKIVAAYQANPKWTGQHRLAKLASELSARSVRVAHLLALGDSQQVEAHQLEE